MSDLTPKQESFCREYVKKGHQISAYRTAYAASGMKDSTVSQRAKELLQDGRITDRIAKLREDAERASVVTVSKTLNELAKIAFGTLPGVVNYSKGTMSITDFDNLSDEQKACIKKFECVTEHVMRDGEAIPVTKVKVELYDKKAALDSIAKHLGMFVDRVDIRKKNVNVNINLGNES